MIWQKQKPYLPVANRRNALVFTLDWFKQDHENNNLTSSRAAEMKYCFLTYFSVSETNSNHWCSCKILFIFLFTLVVNIEPSSRLQKQQIVAVFLFRFWWNYPDVDYTSRKFLWTFWNGETGSVFDSTSLSSIYQWVFETQNITYSFKWKLGQIWADRLSLHTTKTWILHSCQ